MKILNIFFNEPPKKGPYGGAGHFVTNFMNFLEKKGHKVLFKLHKSIDLIFIISNSEFLYKKKTKSVINYKKKNQDVKIIHRINNCDKRKNTKNIDKLIFNSNKIADETVFLSEWLARYFIEKGFNRDYHVIYNGCNPEIFYPAAEKKKLKEPINLITHHWSNHWMKGFDIYNEIDILLNKRDDLNFTYIGNYNEIFKPKNIKLIPPLSGIDLGKELRKADIYITASRWEPGANHNIEGARCGLPVLYHRDGGSTKEVSKSYGLEFHDIPSLQDSIDKIIKSYNEFRNKIPYDFLSSDMCCEEYYELIQSIFK